MVNPIPARPPPPRSPPGFSLPSPSPEKAAHHRFAHVAQIIPSRPRLRAQQSLSLSPSRTAGVALRANAKAGYEMTFCDPAVAGKEANGGNLPGAILWERKNLASQRPLHAKAVVHAKRSQLGQDTWCEALCQEEEGSTWAPQTHGATTQHEARLQK